MLFILAFSPSLPLHIFFSLRKSQSNSIDQKESRRKEKWKKKSKPRYSDFFLLRYWPYVIVNMGENTRWKGFSSTSGSSRFVSVCGEVKRTQDFEGSDVLMPQRSFFFFSAANFLCELLGTCVRRHKNHVRLNIASPPSRVAGNIRLCSIISFLSSLAAHTHTHTKNK